MATATSRRRPELLFIAKTVVWIGLFVAAAFAAEPVWRALSVPQRMLAAGGAMVVVGLWLIGPQLTRVFVGKAVFVLGLVLAAVAALGIWVLPFMVDTILERADATRKEAVAQVRKEIVDSLLPGVATTVPQWWDTLKAKAKAAGD